MKKHVKETSPIYAVSHNYKHEKYYEAASDDHSLEIMSPSTKKGVQPRETLLKEYLYASIPLLNSSYSCTITLYLHLSQERLSKIGEKFIIIQRSKGKSVLSVSKITEEVLKDVPCEGEYFEDPTVEQSSIVRLNVSVSSDGESMGDPSVEPSSFIGIHTN
ncbi:hypothetical protein H5410_040266 [Solanum commersonii]|uniref:Uncharacterized protein n=1 Tax=Solanum commersonii TaxID=4109 RepID=A0A9J5XRK5_SOLCO|nr:hypothetical protein H5410_040266 [Solanum commersonii]